MSFILIRRILNKLKWNSLDLSKYLDECIHRILKNVINVNKSIIILLLINRL